MGDVSNEPSMEEILASIKKIIAEDGDRAPPKPRRSTVRENRFDELGEELRPLESDAEVSAPKAADGEDEASDVSAEDEVLELTDSVAEQQPMTEKPNVSLVSSNTEVASRTALASLSALVVKPDVHGSDTLEGMVREMLKPMLKEWLDAKLPDLVEQMVAKEIARISGRGL